MKTMIRKQMLSGMLCMMLLGAGPVLANAQSQTLARVGDTVITSDQLQQAVASSPFATQFTTMDEDDQAMLRGDLLRRLVTARLLYLEAREQGLEQTPRFRKELEEQRLGLLYRYYMDRLREHISIPQETLQAMRRQLQGDPDGLAAAEAAYRADAYRTLRLLTIRSLREQHHLVLHEDRIRPGVTGETVLMEGDGILIRYGDVVDSAKYPVAPNPEWVKERLYQRAELLLIAQAAEKEGVDVSRQLARFEEERLPAMLLERMEARWVPDEQAMRRWYEAHPDVGRLDERRHVGQLVVASRAEAEELHRRILAGESLFALAGQYSIDPYGRERRGDMGWIREGRGHPALDRAISGLADGQISEVVETPQGFHILTVLERRPGGQRGYAAIRDKIRQLMISEQLGPYLAKLERRYGVTWDVVASAGGSTEGTTAPGGDR